MREKYFDPNLDAIFRMSGVREPDLILHAMELEKEYRAEWGDEFPLREIRGKYLSGCYAWFEEGENDEKPQIMYVGKALRMGNRLVQHWNGSGGFLLEWYKEREADNLCWVPYIAIWFTEDRAAMEVDLTRRLKPKFNRRRE